MSQQNLQGSLIRWSCRISDMLCVILQTRSLLSVFEEDAGNLTEYTNQLLQAMQRVFGAQVPKRTHFHIYTHTLYIIAVRNSETGVKN